MFRSKPNPLEAVVAAQTEYIKVLQAENARLMAAAAVPVPQHYAPSPVPLYLTEEEEDAMWAESLDLSIEAAQDVLRELDFDNADVHIDGSSSLSY